MASIVDIDCFCKSIFSKSIGLMFSKPKNIVLEFKKPRRIGLHMLFVFYPIDVLFLDENKKIVEIKENLGPFWFYSSKKNAKYAVEIGKQEKQRKKFEIGDVVLLRLTKQYNRSPLCLHTVMLLSQDIQS